MPILWLFCTRSSLDSWRPLLFHSINASDKNSTVRRRISPFHGLALFHLEVRQFTLHLHRLPALRILLELPFLFVGHLIGYSRCPQWQRWGKGFLLDFQSVQMTASRRAQRTPFLKGPFWKTLHCSGVASVSSGVVTCKRRNVFVNVFDAPNFEWSPNTAVVGYFLMPWRASIITGRRL